MQCNVRATLMTCSSRATCIRGECLQTEEITDFEKVIATCWVASPATGNADVASGCLRLVTRVTLSGPYPTIKHAPASADDAATRGDAVLGTKRSGRPSGEGHSSSTRTLAVQSARNPKRERRGGKAEAIFVLTPFSDRCRTGGYTQRARTRSQLDLSPRQDQRSAG